MDMDKAKRLFNIEKGINMLGGGGWLKFCVCAFGLWKIGEVKGKAYNLARTKGLWPVSRKARYLFGPEIKYSNRNKKSKSAGPGLKNYSILFH